MYRGPLKEAQGSWHSSGRDLQEPMNGYHRWFGLSWVMNSQLEVTKIMVIVRKSGNWDGPILGKTILCTIVGLATDVDGLICQECTHSVSRVYSVRGFIFVGGIATTSCLLV